MLRKDNLPLAWQQLHCIAMMEATQIAGLRLQAMRMGNVQPRFETGLL
jgi:hypothetical protein